MKKHTITDVAALAGVSIKTVSRVLNQEPNVRPATRDKVSAAIKSLHYRPSASARSLAGSRSFLLALLYDNPSASYVTKVQNGVLATCRRQQYDLLIHPCDYRGPDLGKEITELVRNTRLDGMILTPPLTDADSVRRTLKKLGTAHVFLSPGSKIKSKWTVGTNDREVSAAMVKHLVGLGHTRIAFILGHPDHRAIANRFEGFKLGMAEAGLRVLKSLCVQGYNSFESGVECANRLLDMKASPTAIFASNDDQAAGALKAAHERGVAIPGELSVAGFDDIPLASQVWPSLTTIRQPMQEMAELAASLLIKRLRGQEPNRPDRILDSELVVRDSTGPVRAA